MMAAVLESVIYLIQECTQLEYETYIQPNTRLECCSESMFFTCKEGSNPSYYIYFYISIFVSSTNSLSRPLFCGPKTVQASVTLLDSLPIFLEKTNNEELEQDILPMLYMAMESSMSQVEQADICCCHTQNIARFKWLLCR